MVNETYEQISEQPLQMMEKLNTENKCFNQKDGESKTFIKIEPNNDSGEGLTQSKLRYGRVRHNTKPLKSQPKTKVVKVDSSQTKVPPKTSKAKQTNGQPENGTHLLPSSSPSDHQEERLPKLTLIKRPKRKLSSSTESYFIESKPKDNTVYIVSSCHSTSSESVNASVQENEEQTEKSKKISPISLYCKIEGSSIVDVSCKRFKRRPIKYEEEEIVKPVIKSSSLDDHLNDEGNDDEVVQTLMQDLLNKVNEEILDNTHTVNFESPGTNERTILGSFCDSQKMEFDDFSDLSVFVIRPLTKESIEKVPSYSQVPKKCRYEKCLNPENVENKEDESNSSGYSLRKRHKTQSQTRGVKSKRQCSAYSESSDETIKSENIPDSEPMNCTESLLPLITMQEENEATSSNERDERDEIKIDIDALINRIDDDCESMKKECDVEETNEIVSENNEEENMVIDEGENSETNEDENLENNEYENIEDIYKNSPKSENNCDASTSSKMSTSNQEEVDSPLDLSNKDCGSPQRDMSIPRSLILNSIPHSSSNMFNCPNFNKPSTSVKRSLTVRKLLSLNRERQKGVESPKNPSPPLPTTSLKTKSLIEQLQSRKFSAEDESILKTLLLDSNKSELDFNGNQTVASLIKNNPELTPSPSELVKNKSKQSSYLKAVEYLPNESINNTTNPVVLQEKIKKLKNEILCLDIMADQKEKERVAIICFKRYKEEILKKILKRHNISAQKGRIENPGMKNPNISALQRSLIGELPPVEAMVAKAHENYGVELNKMDEHVKAEPLNLEMSPLMYQLSQKKYMNSPKNSSQCSALKEQLLSKPKGLAKIAPKPISSYQSSLKAKLSESQISKSNINRRTSQPHSALTTRLQAPIWYPMAVPWPSKDSPKSDHSSPAPEISSSDISVQKCSTCKLLNASFLCSRCQKEWYCSTRCQAIHWPSHSSLCTQ